MDNLNSKSKTMGPLASLGMQTASQGIGALFGLMLEKHNDRRQLRQQQALQDMQIRGSKEMTDYQQQKQMEMWQATGPVGQMEQLKKAGLNPSLIYGMGGAGGQTVGGGASQVSGADAPKGGGETMQCTIMGLQLAQQAAQTELVRAQTENIQADTDKKKGVDTKLAESQVALNTLEAVIKEYTGKEAKAQWLINDELRTAEYGTKANELAARSAVAEQVAKIHEEGLLYNKTNKEIEALILSNAKSEEETKNIKKTFELIEQNIKGKSIENAILDLERKLQEKTGLDKNSQGWLKILGRLFIGLTGE